MEFKDMINNISTIYKVYYSCDINNKTKIFIFRYTSEDSEAESMVEYIVHNMTKGYNAYICNILSYTMFTGNNKNIYEKIKNDTFYHVIINNMLLSDIIEFRTFSTNNTIFKTGWELVDSPYMIRYLRRQVCDVFEPMEIAYYEKNEIIDAVNKVNNVNKVNKDNIVNKFMNYDI